MHTTSIPQVSTNKEGRRKDIQEEDDGNDDIGFAIHMADCDDDEWIIYLMKRKEMLGVDLLIYMT